MSFISSPYSTAELARHASIRDARDRLDRIARLLDSAVRIPGTGLRVGADAFLNLVPGVGLLTSKGLSAYLIWEARRLGVPAGTLVRMIAHVGVDLAISAVPLIGWAGDAFYRANTRNMALLRAHLDREIVPPESQRLGPELDGAALREGVR